MATKIDPTASLQIKKSVNLSSLFQARLAETPKKPMPPIDASVNAEEVVSPSESSKENSPEKEKIC